MDRLRALSERGDIIKRLHNVAGGDVSRYRLGGLSDVSAPVDGVVRGKGLHDELHGDLFAAVETAGRRHPLRPAGLVVAAPQGRGHRSPQPGRGGMGQTHRPGHRPSGGGGGRLRPDSAPRRAEGPARAPWRFARATSLPGTSAASNASNATASSSASPRDVAHSPPTSCSSSRAASVRIRGAGSRRGPRRGPRAPRRRTRDLPGSTPREWGRRGARCGASAPSSRRRWRRGPPSSAAAAWILPGRRSPLTWRPPSISSSPTGSPASCGAAPANRPGPCMERSPLCPADAVWARLRAGLR